MRVRVIVRMAVASLFGGLTSWFISLDYAKWRTLGREAFLSFNGRRFDEHIAAPSSGAVLIAGISAVAAIGAYEGVVVLVMKLLSRPPEA
jgi:hypothetical protein